MSRLNAFLWRLAGCALAGLALTAAVCARAADGAGPGVPEIPKLAALVLPGEVIGREQILRQVLRCGSNEFGFVIPEGLRSRVSPEGAIVLAPSDQTYILTIRQVEPATAIATLKQAMEQQVASTHPEAERTDEFSMMVAGHEGMGVDLRKEVPKVGSRFIRVLWVPFRAGVLEFTVNADRKHAADARGGFDAVVLTFRSNESGKLEFVRRLDRS